MPRSFLKTFKRAAIFAALFLFCEHSVYAEKTETYKDLIDKAYNLSLQQDRPQAISILVTAMKRESRKAQPPKELTQALEDISTMFYSDKAQQLFETGLSLKASDPALAVSKFNEALRLEPENLSIQTETIRLQIYSNDCAGAQKLIKKIQEINPFNDTIRLHAYQSAICLGAYDQADQPTQIENKKSQNYCFYGAAEIERAYKKAEFNKALDRLTALEAACKQYPELYYWRWKIESELKMKNEKSGLSYIAACKKLSAKQVRELAGDPNLCRRIVEVESVVKKSHN